MWTVICRPASSCRSIWAQLARLLQFEENTGKQLSTITSWVRLGRPRPGELLKKSEKPLTFRKEFRTRRFCAHALLRDSRRSRVSTMFSPAAVLFAIFAPPLVLGQMDDVGPHPMEEPETTTAESTSKSYAWVWILTAVVVAAVIIAVVLLIFWKKGKLCGKKGEKKDDKNKKKTSTKSKPTKKTAGSTTTITPTTGTSTTKTKTAPSSKESATKTAKYRKSRKEASLKGKEKAKEASVKEKKKEKRSDKKESSETKMDNVEIQTAIGVEEPNDKEIKEEFRISNNRWEAVDEIGSDFTFSIQDSSAQE